MINTCIIISILSCMFSCCLSDKRKMPDDGEWVLLYRYAFEVNGERIEGELYDPYNMISNVSPGWPYDYAFSGELWEEHNFSGVNYERLAFFLAIYVDGLGLPLYFKIVGDGIGPFKEGVDYSSPDNVVYYYPCMMNSVWSNETNHFSDYPNLDGLKVKLLSSSFRFGYSKSDEKYATVLFDFYFDFEEVITSVPDIETWLPAPAVGDTIRITNGHFANNLYFSALNFEYQFVAPE